MSPPPKNPPPTSLSPTYMKHQTLLLNQDCKDFGKETIKEDKPYHICIMLEGN